MKEKWIQICKIQGYEDIKDCYWISNSDDDVIVNKDTKKQLKGSFDNKGYKIIGLKTIGEGRKNCKIHILKAKAFLYTPNPLNANIVRHLNDCKTDNRLENLTWGTFSDNIQDSIRNGRYNYEGASKGGIITGATTAKKLSKPVRCIETGIIYPNSYEASHQLTIERNGIRNCCHGRQHTAGGFHWEYVN